MDELFYTFDETYGKTKEASEKSKEKAEKDARINYIIKELAGVMQLSDNNCNDIFSKLKTCYTKDYRHSYYAISGVIYTLRSEERAFLSTNLDELKEWMETHNHTGASATGFLKFYDHCKLEIIRLDKNDTEFEKLEKEGLAIIDKIENVKSNIQEEQKGVYASFVTILGIFAAVVLVFFGGATVFTGIFENLHLKELTRWKILFTVSIVGLVVYNLIFMLLYAISKIIKRQIAATENPKYQFFLARWIEKYPYLFVFNLAMIILAIISG